MKKLLGNLEKGHIFVVSAPAGTGKSTLIDLLIEEFPHAIQETCSCTTRSPRPNEIHERHYEFISISEFEHKIEKGEFLEYAKVFGNYYGTPITEVESIQKSGKHAVLVIDTQGAMQLKDKINAIFIFILPPSLDELKRRLFKRRTESIEKIEERLLFAKEEMKMAHAYDYQIVNDDLSITYQILRSIFIASECKKHN